VAALQDDDPTLDLRGMFFAIQTQLLLSNLEHSVLPQPLYPIPGKLATLPQEPSLVHDIFLYGPEKKDAILLQIVSISEVGHSAFQTKNTMEQRKEALSGVGRIRRIRDHMGPGDGNNANGDQQPDEEDNEPDDVPPYPRSMLMLDVSDGYRVMRAMEYKRIDALKLGETALGCKVSRTSARGEKR
jgi:RecQ-mediated genome instability protein 1